MLGASELGPPLVGAGVPNTVSSTADGIVAERSRGTSKPAPPSVCAEVPNTCSSSPSDGQMLVSSSRRTTCTESADSGGQGRSGDCSV